MAGYYSNYFTIINSVSIFVTMSIGALTPSIGNLKAESNDINHHYEVLKEVILLNFLMSAFCTSSLLCLLNPFIDLWIGEKFIFKLPIVIVLCLNFYISTMRFGVGAFGTAAGLFKETVFKPILEGVINLVVSITLVRYYGIIGVFIGTTASLVLGSVWVDPYFLFKKWFNKSLKDYFVTYIGMLVYTILISIIIYSVVFYIPNDGIWGFVYKVVVVVVLNTIFYGMGARMFPGYRQLKKRITSVLAVAIRK